jgi:multicomponent Na+:H+ antiporter subunit E
VIRRLPAFVWLVALWVALWGELTAANVLVGMVVAAAVKTVLPRAEPGPAGTIRPLRAARYFAYFLYKLVEANLLVAWEVVRPGTHINLGIVAVPIRGASDVVITTVANSISLTPGTLTIEVRRDPATLYVHVLHIRTVEDTRTEIYYLEYLALRAFAHRLVGDVSWERWLAQAPWQQPSEETP